MTPRYGVGKGYSGKECSLVGQFTWSLYPPPFFTGLHVSSKHILLILSRHSQNAVIFCLWGTDVLRGVRRSFLHHNSKTSVFKLHLFPDGEKIHVQDRFPMHPLCSILINTIQQLRGRAVRRMVGNGQIHQQFQQILHCLAPQTYKLQFSNDYLQPIHTENIIFHIKNLIIKNSLPAT